MLPGLVTGEYRREEALIDVERLARRVGAEITVGTEWGLVAEGRWVRWLKDVIDRRFVRRFRD